jgi:hypothetical protein
VYCPGRRRASPKELALVVAESTGLPRSAKSFIGRLKADCWIWASKEERMCMTAKFERIEVFIQVASHLAFEREPHEALL